MVLRINSTLGNRYEIVGKIGSGGMSDVYKAHDKKLNRFVAIKVLKDEFAQDESFVAKFNMEAQSAACLLNPNIVNIYDVGEDNGIYYIVMELVEGITLKKYIDRRGKLGIREAIEVSLQVAYGLEAAHAEHIIHRDIKPQNIMISKEGSVFVTDFGIARATSNQTISSNTMGSAHYISPEQARGGYCDERSDIYSLGISMYEMLTGRVPFEGDSTVSVALQHIQGDMVPPSKYEALIPVSLEKIILKCTQKNPDDRYSSATELIADLKKALTSPNEDFVSLKTTTAAAVGIGAGVAGAVSTNSDSGIEVNTPQEDTTIPQKQNPNDDSYVEEDEEEMDEEDIADRKFEKLVTYIGIGVAVVVLALVAIVGIKACGLFGGKTGEVEMIELRGKTYEEATEELTKIGLKIKATYGESSEYPDGQIYEQDVEKGKMVTTGTVINVKIAGGAKTITIPDNLDGFSPEVVKATLKSAGFTNISDTYIEEESDTITEGRVIRTEPGSGKAVPADTEIKLVVSKGGKKVEVPNLMGLSLSQAKKSLESVGLYVGDVSYGTSSSSSKDLVISQGANAGSTVNKGSSVNIVLGSGPEQTTATPTQKPTQPTETQTQPTEPPTQPTEPPTQPTVPSTETQPSSTEQAPQ